MTKGMHLMKTGCNGKISQFSGFHNHLQTKLTCIFYLSELIQKTQFAMTDPVAHLRGLFRTFELQMLTVIDCPKIVDVKAPKAHMLNRPLHLRNFVI